MSDRPSLFGSEFEQRSRYRVHVCLGPNCTARGSRELLAQFEEEIRLRGLESEIEVIGTSCRDRCDWGPSVNVFPGPVFYNQVDQDGVVAIVDEHLVDEHPVERLRFPNVAKGRPGRR